MSAATPRKRSVDHNEDFPTFDDPADMVNAVISALQQPDDKTNVSATYSNEKNIASEVQAYAKIAGQSWTFYVKSLAVSIGRNTDNQSASQIAIDIDLGPAKVVSRSHAAIAYNLDLRCWELKVFGRNGARVDGQKVPVGESSATSLHSGAILDIGGTQMMFILPDSPPDIPRKILHQCLARYQNKSRKSSQSSFPQAHPMSVNNGSQIKSFQMFDKAQLSHSPSSVSATSLQNNLDQDLSKEEAKDIKPPYSYATMITQAILSNQEGVMSLSEIYNWIASHYAYYKFSKTGWQNSIRHNLSLNKAFEKVPRRPNEPGKGMKWRISESYKEEFMNKIQSGSLSKSRRGSSVSRQLQLHLATYQQLPESQREFPKEGVNQFDHQRTDSLSKFGSMPYQGMPSNMSPPIAYMPQQPVNGFINPSRSYGYQHPAHPPHIMYGNSMVPGSVNQSMAHGLNLGKPELASPIRQYGDVSGTTPRLPKVGGNNLFGFPPPASSSNNPIGPASSNQHPHPNTFNDNQNYSSGNNTHTSESNNSNSTAPSTNSDALGFTSPKKILPLEAFTPERGSKPQDASKLNIPSRMSTSQSSPAFWNFVQFSTPNGQTPGRDNNEDVNGHGSPTLNRKYQNSKEDSPLRHRRDEKAIDLKEKSDLEKEDTKNKKSEIAS